MNNLKHILTATLTICFIQTAVLAQQTYYTREGLIEIRMTFRDTVVTASSHQLMVRLNYETGEIRFTVPYGSFRTGILSVDTNFIKLANKSMEYSGKLGISFINTTKHPEQNFDMEGTMLGTVPPVNVRAKGKLLHISSKGPVACELSITIQFSLSALNIQEAFYDANDLIRIDIQHSLLNRVND